MSRAKKRPAREQAPPETSARILRASVTLTIEGPDGAAQDVTTELPPDGLAMLQAVGDSDAPTVDEVATAAQKAAELGLVLLHAAPELVPDVDRLRDVLRRIPGVQAELDRRRAGRGARG